MSGQGDDQAVDERKRATLRRFAALGAASPLVRLGAADGESDTRNAIAGYLATTPGAHFSKVRDDLGLATGETQHHLRRLLAQDRIESTRDGEYKRFFPADQFTAIEQTALGYLRRETPRGMAIALLREPTLTPADLASRLDVSRPTISKYARELESVSLLSRADGYTLERPETLLVLLIRYADSFGPEAVELAADAEGLLRYDG